MAAPQPVVSVSPQPTVLQEDPDRELVRRVIAGDEAAFQILYDRYFPRVYDFVQRRLRNRADAEETVQEVFINLLGSIESFRGEAPFGAWVFGVTRRTVASRFKRKQHTMVPLADDDTSEPVHHGAPQAVGPHEAYECQERLDRLAETAMNDLTADQRELFRLHHLQHHSIQNIARLLNKSEDAVKSNLYRARKVLLAR